MFFRPFQTHADYGDCAEYLAQRTLQAYELSQFVKHTSQGCDAVIVGGDLNMTPNELAFKLVLANANLLDCWTSQVSVISSCSPASFVLLKTLALLSATSDKSVRVYFQTYKVENEADGHTSNLKDILGDSHKQSKRIDYLLFRNNTGRVDFSEIPHTVQDHVNFVEFICGFGPRELGEYARFFVQVLTWCVKRAMCAWEKYLERITVFRITWELKQHSR